MKTSLLAPLFLASLVAQAQTTSVQIVDDPTSRTIPSTVVMGSTGSILAEYRFMNSSTENASVTNLAIVDITTSRAAFSNLALWSGSTLVATAGTAVAASNGHGWTYFIQPFVVPARNSTTLILRGDAASYASGGAQDDSTHQFQVVGGLAYGVPIRVLRSTLSVSTAPNSLSNGTLTFSASFAGAIALDKISITFGDERGTPIFFNPTSISLLDENNENVALDSTAFTLFNGNTITWFFPQGWIVGAGASVNFTLMSPFPVRATIASASDIAFTDGLDSAAIAGLDPSLSPTRITRER